MTCTCPSAVRLNREPHRAGCPIFMREVACRVLGTALGGFELGPTPRALPEAYTAAGNAILGWLEANQDATDALVRYLAPAPASPALDRADEGAPE